MKKSVLALAVLGAFAGVASAQSSVTMFGVVDLNVSRSTTMIVPTRWAPTACPAAASASVALKIWVAA